MKILGIVCSPRKGGNTEILVREALKAAGEAGAETDLFLMSTKNVAPCDGCGTCEESGGCKINDDMQELYQKLESSDGVIFGTPVYFANVSAQAKAIIDRTYALLRTRKLRGKVAGAVAAARRVGASQVLGSLYTYFITQRMIVAGGAVGYGIKKGEVREGIGGSPSLSAVEEARTLGRSIVRMLGRVSKEKN